MEVSEEYLNALSLYETKYIKYKRKNNIYDFTDFPLYLLELLQEYNEVINDIDALFVDEVQDIDKDQFEVFQYVQCKKKFFIGDEKQCIYIFRNADPDIFSKFGEE